MKYIEDIYFFEVNTKYISSSESLCFIGITLLYLCNLSVKYDLNRFDLIC